MRDVVLQVFNTAVRKEENQTIITELVLQGLGEFQNLQIIIFFFFLGIYILTITANLTIIGLVVTNHNLHTPMYFFLANLSCLETVYSSTILPKVLVSFLQGGKIISLRGCITQFYFFAALIVTECGLLGMMSYDRYVAICRPLHYATHMTENLYCFMAATAWMFGFLSMSILTYLMTQLTFCNCNTIEHFFCDFAAVLRIACSETHTVELVSFIFSVIFTFAPFLLILTSYMLIMAKILRIPSVSGRQKAFSTCFSHLIVVAIFYGTIAIVYVLPDNERMKRLNKMFSVFYTIITPLLNPLIYSLRNREVKDAFWKTINKLIQDIKPQKRQENVHRLG